jgi:hypothetical protein
MSGGVGEHRLPTRRIEYLVDPDPAGWGADAARRVAPPVLGEDDGGDTAHRTAHDTADGTSADTGDDGGAPGAPS